MNKNLLFHFFVVLLVIGSPTFSQTHLSETSRIVVFRSSAGDVHGRLISLDAEKLLVRTTAGEEYINRAEIERIYLRKEPRQGQGKWIGSIIGGYALMVSFGTKDASTSDRYAYFLYPAGGLLALPGALLGGLFGFWIDPGLDGEDILFDFRGGPEEKHQEWLRLDETVQTRKRLHISLQGAYLYGFELYDEDMSRYNLLRKLQVTYSLSKNSELGIAVMPFGELHFFGISHAYDSKTMYWTPTWNATGYYLVAKYVLPPLELYTPMSSSGINISVGCGLGWLSHDYSRVVEGYHPSPSGPFVYAESKTAFSGLIFSEFSLRLYEGLSLSLVLDRLFAEKIRDRGEPSIDFAPIDVVLGTWGLGISIGMHF